MSRYVVCHLCCTGGRVTSPVGPITAHSAAWFSTAPSITSAGSPITAHLVELVTSPIGYYNAFGYIDHRGWFSNFNSKSNCGSTGYREHCYFQLFCHYKSCIIVPLCAKCFKSASALWNHFVHINYFLDRISSSFLLLTPQPFGLFFLSLSLGLSQALCSFQLSEPNQWQ